MEKGKATKVDAEKTTAGGSPRLPAGRHGLPREFVVQHQRERIVTALVDTVSERGYNATTVASITKAAAVSRRTFYEHFANKEACFLAAYEMVVDHIAAEIRTAVESFEEWPQKVCAALSTTLRLFAGEPELARLCLIETIASGGEIAARHRAAIQGLVGILKTGRPEHRGERQLPDVTEEILVGGIASLLMVEISAGRGGQLESLRSELTELALGPFVGVEEARRLAGG